VHGCFEEFQVSFKPPHEPPTELLLKIEYDPGTTTLILVGDLVNKGPYSAEMVQYCRERNMLCVRGNHDDVALNHKKQEKRDKLAVAAASAAPAVAASDRKMSGDVRKMSGDVRNTEHLQGIRGREMSDVKRLSGARGRCQDHATGTGWSSLLSRT